MKTYQCVAYFVHGSESDSVTYYQQADNSKLAEIGFDFFLDWYMLDPDFTQVVDVPYEMLPSRNKMEIC